jgi:hypothetical protein
VYNDEKLRGSTLIATVHIETTIAAPIDVIWEIMLDLKGYAVWNPFITRVLDGERITAVGQCFRLKVMWSNGKGTVSRERVTDIRPPEGGEARLAYRFSGWLSTIHMVRAERVQTLQIVSDGNVRYSSEEVFTGWGAGWIPLVNVEDGFKRQAAALKLRAERGTTLSKS